LHFRWVRALDRLSSSPYEPELCHDKDRYKTRPYLAMSSKKLQRRSFTAFLDPVTEVKVSAACMAYSTKNFLQSLVKRGAANAQFPKNLRN